MNVENVKRLPAVWKVKDIEYKLKKLGTAEIVSLESY